HVSTVGGSSASSASGEHADVVANDVHAQEGEAVGATATQTYSQTAAKLLTRRGVLWLGQTCNIRCHFCYFLDRIENKEHPEHQFMDIEKAKQICHTLRYKYGNTSIDIQGGEPTIWRHIEELITYCNEIGLYPTLITNAITLARREKCEQLQQAGLRDLLISVQGLGSVYAEIVGLPGGSVKQAKALDNCIEVGIPFRFNCVLSLKALPQYVDIARLAVAKGALAVNFLAFNPFEDQATGHRSTFNVPSYTQVAGELNQALDVLAEAGVEANVRYFPICMVEPRHRKSIYNFPQLSYDPHEWDYDSWSWTGQQPQRMKWGEPSEPHVSLGAITYNSWVFTNPAGDGAQQPAGLASNLKGSVNQVLAPFPGALRTVKRAYWSVLDVARKGRHLVRGDARAADPGLRVPDELGRNPELYRDHAMVRAQDHCRYQYAAQCNECDVKSICHGFPGDYATLFPSDEARPIHLGKHVSDPTYFIRDQVKMYEPEERSRPFREKQPLARNGERHPSAA